MDVSGILKDFLKREMTFCSPQLAEGRETGHDGLILHKHPHRELMLVMEGESEFYLQDRKYVLSPGSAVLIDSWMPHTFGYSEQDHDLLHFWIYFYGGKAACRFCRVGMQGHYDICGIPGMANLPPHFYPLISSRWNELKKQERRTQDEAALYLLNPLRCLLEEVMIGNSRKIRQEPSHSDLVYSLKLYIESQNARDCSLEQLEKIFGYSRFYIAHKFRENHGMTLGAYVNEVRLAFTEDALAKGLKQKEIAYELGFSSSSAFWKWFRQNRK